MRRIAAVGMVAVLGLGVVACGSSKDDAKTATTESQALTATTPSTAPPTTTTPSASSLDDLLLTAAEVGTGWKVVYSGASRPTTDSSGDCLSELSSTGPDRTDRTVEVQDEAGTVQFSESLEFAGDAMAAEFAAAKAILDGCTTLTIDSNGTSVSGTLSPIEFPSFGGSAAAYEAVITGPGGTAVIDVAMVGVDGYEVSTSLFTVGAPDRATFADLTAKAVAKIRSGGGQAA